MKSRFYIAASGDEQPIRLLHNDLKLLAGRVREQPFNPITDKKEQKTKWGWSSAYQKCTGLYPEDELADFLSQNPEVISVLTAHRPMIDEVTAVIAIELNAEDGLRGCPVSSELICLLASINASLDIDINHDLESTHPCPFCAIE
ncbi:MAG: hypothetical protein BWK73_12040 [Thiothrix lacustris]|uniref:DUF4279 domain-containing protein n=1 Tax=Thiothrix lacustris TaxID=525917 RepID=A0A1Y1QTJ5_9GAMM|nr:MAG: hypothetical protein BWK73_12040 [Thiothrix lacustris]